jgi:hypothetical protein
MICAGLICGPFVLNNLDLSSFGFSTDDLPLFSSGSDSDMIPTTVTQGDAVPTLTSDVGVPATTLPTTPSNQGGEGQMGSPLVIVDPPLSDAGDTLSISISGFPAHTELSLRCYHHDTNEELLNRVMSTNGSGTLAFEMTTAPLTPTGTYVFRAELPDGTFAADSMNIMGPEPPVVDQDEIETIELDLSQLPETPPTPSAVEKDPYVTILPYVGKAGTDHTIYATEFQAGERIRFLGYLTEAEAIPEVIFELYHTTDANGHVDIPITIPETYTPGHYTIIAAGDKGSFSEAIFLLEDNSPAPNPNLDSDHDGITDQDELTLAQTYAPYFVIARNDPERGEIRWVYQVTRWTTGPNTVSCDLVIVIVALYQDDWVPTWGWWHHGDTEPVYLCFDVPDVNDIDFGEEALRSITVVRHSKGYTYEYPQEIEMDGTHPVLYISDGKHATYPSYNNCTNANMIDFISTGWFSLGIPEQCDSWTGILADLPEDHNVGEEYFPLFQSTNDRDELRNLYPDEWIWKDVPFCGGTPVQGRHQKLALSQPICAGSIYSKLLPKGVSRD